VVDLDMGADPKRIMVSGDWHGNTHFALESITYAAEQGGCDVMIQVGDFGFWTDTGATRMYLDRVQGAARRAGIRLYWLDGNHEDHSRRAEFNDSGRPNVIYLPRGFRWTWWGKRFMSVGGAVSVDKRDRTPGRSWWPEEELTEDELAYACRDDKTTVDVVFAHDCPLGVDIPGIGPDNDHRPTGAPPGWPPDVLAHADFHRGKMKVIADKMQPELWIHGHYHIPYRLQSGKTTFIGLGCDTHLWLELTSCFIGQDMKAVRSVD
jgi:predicted phosphodiesterase